MSKRITSRQKQQQRRHKQRMRDIYTDRAAIARTVLPSRPLSKRTDTDPADAEVAWPYLPGGER